MEVIEKINLYLPLISYMTTIVTGIAVMIGSIVGLYVKSKVDQKRIEELEKKVATLFDLHNKDR